MTILSSLKALLFSATPLRAAPAEGGKSVPATDFAALMTLNGGEAQAAFPSPPPAPESASDDEAAAASVDDLPSTAAFLAAGQPMRNGSQPASGDIAPDPSAPPPLLRPQALAGPAEVAEPYVSRTPVAPALDEGKIDPAATDLPPQRPMAAARAAPQQTQNSVPKPDIATVASVPEEAVMAPASPATRTEPMTLADAETKPAAPMAALMPAASDIDGVEAPAMQTASPVSTVAPKAKADAPSTRTPAPMARQRPALVTREDEVDTSPADNVEKTDDDAALSAVPADIAIAAPSLSPPTPLPTPASPIASPPAEARAGTVGVQELTVPATPVVRPGVTPAAAQDTDVATPSLAAASTESVVRQDAPPAPALAQPPARPAEPPVAPPTLEQQTDAQGAAAASMPAIRPLGGSTVAASVASPTQGSADEAVRPAPASLATAFANAVHAQPPATPLESAPPREAAPAVMLVAPPPVAAPGQPAAHPVADTPAITVAPASIAAIARDLSPASTHSADGALPLATPAVGEAVAAPTRAVADDPVIDATPRASPARGDAISLLQFARDHMTRPGKSERPTIEPLHARGKTLANEGATSAPVQPDSLIVRAEPAPVTVSATPIPSAAPVAGDLSASLGARVVDMGVSGQWIDGLARDIAGLSANGAQGGFQLQSGQLGAVQVDIRQGADGASVSLTVASDAAEQALKQDADRLRLDANLTAVRIAEVKVERAPHVAEMARADTAGQQSSSQQQSAPQQQGPTGWQAGQGGMAQSHNPHRWQARENPGQGPKAGGDGAVLNHDARESGAAASSAGGGRARYA
jgi:hypothetical protein